MTSPSTKRPPAGRLSALAVAAGLSLTLPGPAFALSELRTLPQTEKAPDERKAQEDAAPRLSPSIPMPDPLVRKPGTAADEGEPAESEPAETAPGPPADERATPAEVLTDVSKIPEPVRRMRQLIVEAAASGDVERLRGLLGKGDTATFVGDGTDEDPVAALKGMSGDGDGLETLAIMLDVLSTGFVHLDKGTPDEMYVWPYFVARPLDQLSAPEKVDLLRLMTAGDFAAMQEFGSYNFYRIGIAPDGQWKFITGGD